MAETKYYSKLKKNEKEKQSLGNFVLRGNHVAMKNSSGFDII